jgi:hypothetical protein
VPTPKVSVPVQCIVVMSFDIVEGIFTSIYVRDAHFARSFLVSSAEYCNQNNRVLCLVTYSDPH